jgi:hypothetical protein
MSRNRLPLVQSDGVMNPIADDPPTLRFVIAWLALTFLFVCVAAKTNPAETSGFRGR